MGARLWFQHFKDAQNIINVERAKAPRDNSVQQIVKVHACVCLDMIFSVSYMFVNTCMAECHPRTLSARSSLKKSNGAHIGPTEDQRCRRQSELASHGTVGAHYCILWAGKCLSARIH